MKVEQFNLTDEILSYIITPDEGKVLRRKSDGAIFDESITLGYLYFINGQKLDTPYLENPIDYDEVIQDTEYIPPVINTLQAVKDLYIKSILEYDSSSNVNGFYLNDALVWLPKVDRLGLINSCTILKEAGLTETTLWFNNKSYTVNIDLALKMLYALELYALECYNITAKHIADIKNKNSIEDVRNYDIYKDYPLKLIFTV